MEVVTDKSFIHMVVGNDPQWFVGAEIETSEKLNRLYSTYENNNSVYIDENNKQITIDLVLRHAQKVYNGKSHKQLKNYHYKVEASFNEAIECIYFNIRLVRELIFESVRMENFHDYPSRKTCIWLIPDDEEHINQWKNNLPGSTHKIYRANCSGKIHYANPKFLEGGSISISSWTDRARRYWTGEDAEESRTEVLFEGKLSVVEEIKDA
jgi:hypothetical protein